MPCCPRATVGSQGWPPRWALNGHVHGSGGRLCDLANCAICLRGLDRSSLGCQDHSAHIPDHDNCPVTARTVQGMARARSGQAPAWPLSSDRSARRGSRVKRDFACTFTRLASPVLVVLRSRSRLRLEGRARTLSGPSPDLSPARTLAPSGRLLPPYLFSLHYQFGKSVALDSRYLRISWPAAFFMYFP